MPLTGTLVLPDTSDVRDGVLYGAGGTEFRGTLVVPGEPGPPPAPNTQPSIWLDIRVAVHTVIQGLGLTYNNGISLPNVQVYRRKLFSDEYTTLPYVMVCRGGRESLADDAKGNFEETETIYPVFVGHVFASNQDLNDDNDDAEAWRQQIIDAFLDLPRPEVTSCEVSDCQIITAPVLDLQAFRESNLDVGGLLLNFRILRPRPGH